MYVVHVYLYVHFKEVDPRHPKHLACKSPLLSYVRPTPLAPVPVVRSLGLVSKECNAVCTIKWICATRCRMEIKIMGYRNPGKTLLRARFHFGCACSCCSRASSSVGACLLPSICRARWRAHSRRFCVGVGGGSQSWRFVDMAAGGGTAGTPEVGCGGNDVAGCCVELVPISISAGWTAVVTPGRLNIRRPIKPKAPRAWSLTVTDTGGAIPPWAADQSERARMRVMCRSRLTIMFVIFTGHVPIGRTLCLHIGQRDELRSRNVSMQSGWKMCRHGSSRTWVSFGSKSSMQIGHVGCEKAVVLAVEAVGAGRWLAGGAAAPLASVPAFAPGARLGWSGFSASEDPVVYVTIGILSKTC